MPEVNAPAPGEFCWIELATSDPVSAKQFYADLFGWTTQESDIGEMGIYYIFQKNGRDVGAMYRMMSDQQQLGIPPNWMSYLGVENAEAAAAKIGKSGGKVLHAPFDVMDHGRMAVVQDPQGAVLALWEAKKHHGIEVRDEANTLCWNELATNDRDGARTFYTQLAGWTTKDSPEYTEFHLGEKALGGMRSIMPGEQMPPNWMPYFLVDDCNAATSKVQEKGGKVCVPPMDLPNVGRFSVVSDPQGAVFALFKNV